MCKRFTTLLGLSFALSTLTACGVPQAASPLSPKDQTLPTGLIFLGPYSPTTAYLPTDVVTYDGSSYVAISAGTAIPPIGNTASANDWSVLAQAGAPGQMGAPGQTGSQGVAGAQGTPGAMGPQGPSGAKGSQGANGLLGPQGVSGATGSPGVTGAAGPQGSSGPQGPAGPQGATGPQGIAGPQGISGPAGAPGVAGATGIAGTIGAAGPQGLNGVAGPTGSTGAPGAPGIDGSSSSFLKGKTFSVQGDSIAAANYWQKTVVARTGMVQISQDARPGRAFVEAFECYGNPAQGAAPGVYNASIYPGYCTSKDGSSLADNLAGVDVLIIELGTNDQGDSIGQLGDANTTRTLFGYMRWVVETYIAAKPRMRIVLVTPQYNTLTNQAAIQQNVNAMTSYGNSMGVPVINMYALGGVNALNSSALLEDGIHPTAASAQTLYGPVIAQALLQLY